jgi:hypothetical protein
MNNPPAVTLMLAGVAKLALAATVTLVLAAVALALFIVLAAPVINA